MSWSAEIGRIGEQMVADYLKRKGYIIFKRNFHSKYGEIDIVAEKPDIILFVEVKTRKKDSLVSPADAVDYLKRQKIVKTAEVFMGRAYLQSKVRFDIAEVIYRRDENGDLKFGLNYIENAFLPDRMINQ